MLQIGRRVRELGAAQLNSEVRMLTSFFSQFAVQLSLQVKSHGLALRVGAGLLCGFVMGIATPTYAANMRGDTLLMTGSGSTFINPLFSKWFSEYNKLNPKVEINYQSKGSGQGITDLTKRTVDFAASDVVMTADEIKKAGSDVLHFPVAIGAVVLAYNLPSLKVALKLDPAAISAIARGHIKKWNDPKLAALNRGVSLPDQPIFFIYRSDGSGTTGVFTDYLSRVDADFAKEVGAGKAVRWPTGLGGKGNEGVTANLKNTVGAIGYIENTYALAEKMATAQLKNKEGQFVAASLDSMTEAAAQTLKAAGKGSADLRISLINASGKKSYPMTSFTFLLAYPKTPAPAGTELVKFMNWAMAQGQKLTTPLHYAPLPPNLIKLIQAEAQKIAP